VLISYLLYLAFETRENTNTVITGKAKTGGCLASHEALFGQSDSIALNAKATDELSCCPSGQGMKSQDTTYTTASLIYKVWLALYFAQK
jgi:hypothetical protein